MGLALGVLGSDGITHHGFDKRHTHKRHNQREGQGANDHGGVYGGKPSSHQQYTDHKCQGAAPQDDVMRSLL